MEYDERLETLKVIDRKKNIVKLAQSCFVAPEYLENVFVASPLVVNIWVHADIRQEFVVGVVIPNQDLLMQWAHEHGMIGQNFAEVCKSTRAIAFVLQSLSDVGKREGLQGYEIPRGLILESTPWMPETGEMTVSFKPARNALLLKYRTALRGLYKSLGGIDLGQAEGGRGRGCATTADNGDEEEDSAIAIAALVSPSSSSLELDEAPSKVLTKLICEVASTTPEKIDWSSPLADHGVDSGSFILLSSLLNAHQLPVPALEKLFAAPLSELRDYVDGKAAGGPEQAVSASVDFEKECQIPSQIVELIHAHVTSASASTSSVASPRVSTPRSVFLTGATGFLGTFILQCLLKCGQHVICLVRSKRGTRNCLDRILETAKDFGTLDIIAANLDKIEVVCGDLAMPRFGLSEHEYSYLLGRIDTVMHNGAQVNGVLSYAALRATNVDSVLTCLGLAIQARARLVYTSSLSALWATESGSFEDDSACKSKFSKPPFSSVYSGFHPSLCSSDSLCSSFAVPSSSPLKMMDGYGATKRVAEILLSKVFQMGYKNMCIIRPGTIGPSSSIGCLSPGDTITRYLCSIVQLGIAPDIRQGIAMCSVADVATFAVFASLGKDICTASGLGIQMDSAELKTEVKQNNIGIHQKGEQTKANINAAVALGNAFPPVAINEAAVLFGGSQEPCGPSYIPAFNLSGPSIVTVHDITKAARESGFTVNLVSYEGFVQCIMRESDQSRCQLAPIKSYFRSDSFVLGEEIGISSTATDLKRSEWELGYERIDETVMKKCYSWLIARHKF